jgi:outer membrane immunogenic protein
LGGPFINETKIEAFGLITGQLGCAWNNALLYVRGGAAVTANRYRTFFAPTNTLVGSGDDDTRWGGVVGVGFEYGFAPNWSAGIEYDHMFMSDRAVNFTDTTGVFFGNDRIRQDIDLVTVRVNYRFGRRAVLIFPFSQHLKSPGIVRGFFVSERIRRDPL